MLYAIVLLALLPTAPTGPQVLVEFPERFDTLENCGAAAMQKAQQPDATYVSRYFICYKRDKG